ncbi:MAG: hypothetical protein WC860_00400 [Candidatus Margulisiibacteriota bacterium]|jgi:hypothetical protein
MQQKFNLNANILEILKNIGLQIDPATGGKYIEGGTHIRINKIEDQISSIEINHQKISFLTPLNFLNTIKIVENTLHYKLFDS